MKFVFLLLLFLFSVNGWAACSETIYTTSFQCSGGAASCSGCSVSGITMTGTASGSFGSSCSPGSGTVTLNCKGTPNFGLVVSARYSRSCTGSNYGARGTFEYKVCDSLDVDPCAELRSECESMGGSFIGISVSDNGQTCCRSSCNVCGGGAMKNLYNAKSKICCDNGQAPPDSNQTCQTVAMPTSGCGMVVSSYGDFTSGGWQCGDPSTSFEAAKRYRQQCFDGSSSSTPNSSGGSSGGSSGNQDCQECPYLEAILDTLTKQKHTVDDIYDCIIRPGFCGEQKKDSLTIPDWVETKMDKMIEFDSTNAQVTKSVDSVLKRVLVTDSAILNSDSMTRLAIVHGVDSLVNVIKNSSGGDSLGEYIDRIANLLGVQTSTLSHHLDSILNHIPNDILDSIYKYQKTSLVFFDSSFFVFGEGFGKIDNLTDSAIKYFRQGFYYDSVYSTVYRDSLGEIHDAINSLSTSIGYALGYGDTATSTLRQDLFSISEEIQRRIGSFDSSVSAGNDSLLRLLNPGSIDTVGLGAEYGGIITRGERKGDSIVNSLGWGGIDTLNIDSLYARALSGYKSDSISQSVLDSLNELGGRLNDSLVAKNDSIKNALPGVLDSMADSLVLWAPFADFDSIIYSSIGAHIPNRADCPEDCQKWTVSIPIIGLHSYTVDFGLCLGRASFAGMSVLGFLKLLIRIIVAYTCIMTVGKVLVRMV